MKNVMKALGVVVFIGGVFEAGKIVGLTNACVEFVKNPDKAQRLNVIVNETSDKIKGIVRESKEKVEALKTEQVEEEGGGDAEPEPEEE